MRYSPFAKNFSGQILTKYFELKNEEINNNLQRKGRVNLNNQQRYHMDYGTCTLTCVHNKFKPFNIKIQRIICGGIYYTLPIEIPYLPIDNLRENLLNFLQLMYDTD